MVLAITMWCQRRWISSCHR